MIKMKSFTIQDNQEKALKELNTWKESINLPDDNIKNVYFTASCLQCIYAEPEKEELKYAKQCCRIGRGRKKGQGQILSIDAALSKAPTGNSPLEMHSNYSRYVITLIDRRIDVKERYKKQCISPFANIPVNDIDDIVVRTGASVLMLLMYKMGMLEKNHSVGADCSQQLNSPAYTQKINVGTFRGKTPAQVLIENPNNADSLKDTEKWLMERISAHPGNKAQYEAIVEAFKMFQNRTLKAENNKQTNMVNEIEIYKSSYKPLTSRTRKDGKSLIYGVKITCDITKDTAPFHIEVDNFYAPVIEGDDKMMNVQYKQAEDRERNTIDLTEKEWTNCVGKMERLLNHFENSIAPELFRRSENGSFHSK